MFNKTLLKLLFISTTLSLSAHAIANERDIVARTVPASACQLADHAQGDLAFLSYFGWQFKANQIGSVKFYCPFPVNSNTISNQPNDNYISGITTLYKDPDGKGSAVQITVQMQETTASSVHYSPLWDSNWVHSPYHHEAAHKFSKALRPNSIVSFEVTMSRTQRDLMPYFSGIRFERFYVD